MEFRHVIKSTITMTRFEFYGNLNKYHDANSLSHKQSPLYGKQNPNAKYYKRIGEPGNYTYFQTKADWDAHVRQETFRKNQDASKHEGDNKTNPDIERKKMYQGLADQARKHNEELAQKEKNEKQNEFNSERGAEAARIKKYANSIKNGNQLHPMRDVYYDIIEDLENTKEFKQFDSDVTYGSRHELYEPSYDPYEDYALDDRGNLGVLNPDKNPKYEYDENGQRIIPDMKFNNQALEQEYNDLLDKLLDDARKAKKAAGYKGDDENLEKMLKYYLDSKLFDSWLDWYHPRTGTDRYWDLKQEEINNIIKKQDQNMVSVSVNGKKVK